MKTTKEINEIAWAGIACRIIIGAGFGLYFHVGLLAIVMRIIT